MNRNKWWLCNDKCTQVWALRKLYSTEKVLATFDLSWQIHYTTVGIFTNSSDKNNEKVTKLNRLDYIIEIYLKV